MLLNISALFDGVQKVCFTPNAIYTLASYIRHIIGLATRPLNRFTLGFVTSRTGFFVGILLFEFYRYGEYLFFSLSFSQLRKKEWRITTLLEAV